MTIGEIMTAHAQLAAIRKERLPRQAAYWLGRLLDQLDRENLRAVEMRNELIKQLGADSGGGVFKVKPECVEEYMATLQKDFNVEVEIQVQPIRLDVFGVFEPTANELQALGKLIEAPDGQGAA